jgi:hypothetical protein
LKTALYQMVLHRPFEPAAVIGQVGIPFPMGIDLKSNEFKGMIPSVLKPSSSEPSPSKLR